MKTIVIFILLTITTVVNAQEKIQVDLFMLTQDYLNSTYSHEGATMIVKELGDSHIRMKKIINPTTGKKIRFASSSWALNYKGGNYFNLKYSTDLNNQRVFVKMDIEGKNYCAIIIDENSPRIIKNSGIYYGGGLQGVLIKESNKWNTNWKDENGSKKKILLIDLNNKEAPMMGVNTYCSGYLLRRKDVKNLFGVNKPLSEIKKMSFEEIVSIIEMHNKN
jgi:hypothetical protein